MVIYPQKLFQRSHAYTIWAKKLNLWKNIPLIRTYFIQNCFIMTHLIENLWRCRESVLQIDFLKGVNMQKKNIYFFLLILTMTFFVVVFFTVALKQHVNGTSKALPQHFQGISTALPLHFKINKNLNKWYRCFYLQRLRESVSPVHRILWLVPGYAVIPNCLGLRAP